jgi:hypothetical protein
MVEHIIADFAAQRDLGIYIPNFGSCGMCGVQEYCSWVGGSKAIVSIESKGK